jgi:hypothetical protein
VVPTAGIGTPETYIGYGRANAFDSPERVLQDQVQTYTAPGEPEQNRFLLGGEWRIEEERAVLVGNGGILALRYHASTANLVMGREQAPVEAEVTLDGAAVPEGLRGADLFERDGKTYVRIDAHRLYGLIDARGKDETHTLRLRYLAPGVSAYAFTFG